MPFKMELLQKQFSRVTQLCLFLRSMEQLLIICDIQML